MRSGKERRAPLSLCVALFNLRGKVQQEAASVLLHFHIETAMLIVQCASAQCDLCIGTQLCIERSDTAVAGTVRRSAHSSVTVDPGGSAAGTSHHQHHPLSSTITILPLFLTASRESHNVVHDCSKRVQHALCSYLPRLCAISNLPARSTSNLYETFKGLQVTNMPTRSQIIKCCVGG